MSTTAAAFGAALISLVLAHAWIQARRNLQRIESHVGWRLMIHPLIPVPLPDTPWICRGFGWVWRDKHTRRNFRCLVRVWPILTATNATSLRAGRQ